MKSLRLQAALTQNQVAESLGVTPGYISNVENNRTVMSLRILTYYARLVGCSLDSLVGELKPKGHRFSPMSLFFFERFLNIYLLKI